MKDGRPLGLAGLWEEWKTPDGSLLDTFSILTTTANKLVATVHERITNNKVVYLIKRGCND